MSKAIVKDNHITVMGTKYFTANAQTVNIGSDGEKKKPLIGQNKLEVKGHLAADKLNGKIKTIPPIEIDTVKSSKKDYNASVSASLKVIGVSIAENAVFENLTTNHLKLVQLFVEEEAMRKVLNEAPRALDRLRGYGQDARIVNAIFLVVKAELAHSFTSGGHIDVEADVAGIISVKASGGSTVQGKDTLILSPHTCIAYSMLKLNWNKDKTRIDSTDVDEWSFN